ncbi:hypothetical protein NQ315_003530 [Exocentrus adspersus]|uniref:Uncharacterized protein n=1 Tax=Exocentrus adspersus TaxID=1586481 RepID=A0AAV8V7A4_9CUCU|nr:hypothetical protein NQ315_003530 [Exocentrus adspersus]
MAERTVFVDLPNWWKLKKSLILYKTAEKAVYYKLVLPNLQHILQFYQLYVEPFKCSSDIHHASATLIVPWGNQDQHAYFTLWFRCHGNKYGCQHDYFVHN